MPARRARRSRGSASSSSSASKNRSPIRRWCISLDATVPPPPQYLLASKPSSSFVTPTGVNDSRGSLSASTSKANVEDDCEITILSETVPLSRAQCADTGEPGSPKRLQNEDTDIENTPPPPSLIRSREHHSFHCTPPRSQHTRELYKVVSSPSFLKGYEKIKEYDAGKFHVNEVVRRKDDRKLLHGFDCKCCAKYYSALGLDSAERQKRVDQVSRHRGIQEAPSTPEHYWEVKMADREEQERRGQIAETSSPLGLRPRNHFYEAKALRRKLF